MGKIADLPLKERPREKALLYGISSCSDLELLAILISTGTKGKSALDLSSELLQQFHGLYKLSFASPSSLYETMGLKKSKALVLASCFEIARRLKRLDGIEKEDLHSPAAIYLSFRDPLLIGKAEAMVLLLFDIKGKLIKEKHLYKGNKKAMAFSSKEILQFVLSNEAESFIIVHNHPSGYPLPSQDDVSLTYELLNKGKQLGIKLEDHLIVGEEDYYSFKECELL